MPKTKNLGATKTEAKKATKKEKPKLDYHLEVDVNGVVYKYDAMSLHQALTDFVNDPAFPHGAKTRAFIKFNKGDAERHQLWHANEARRVFGQMRLKPEAIELWASRFTALLG